MKKKKGYGLFGTNRRKPAKKVDKYTEEYFDGSKNFIENQQMIPARLGLTEEKELEEVILKTLDAFEIKFGCCHIEVKLTSDGFKIIEINSLSSLSITQQRKGFLSDSRIQKVLKN